jgi:hypothetical protein
VGYAPRCCRSSKAHCRAQAAQPSHASPSPITLPAQLGACPQRRTWLPLARACCARAKAATMSASATPPSMLAVSSERIFAVSSQNASERICGGWVQACRVTSHASPGCGLLWRGGSREVGEAAREALCQHVAAGRRQCRSWSHRSCGLVACTWGQMSSKVGVGVPRRYVRHTLIVSYTFHLTCRTRTDKHTPRRGTRAASQANASTRRAVSPSGALLSTVVHYCPSLRVAAFPSLVSVDGSTRQGSSPTGVRTNSPETCRCRGAAPPPQRAAPPWRWPWL